MNELTTRNPRPLLITFHCGLYFALFSLVMMSISRKDIQAAWDEISPHHIPTMLMLMGVNFLGYMLLWNLRKSAFILLIPGAILLAVYGHFLSSAGVSVNFIPHYLPAVAVLTTFPLLPILK